MVLVDMSVWVSHFRKGDPHLQELLAAEQVLCHPFITGELACGGLKNRKEIISLLKALPGAITAEIDEILEFIEHQKLIGVGIGPCLAFIYWRSVDESATVDIRQESASGSSSIEHLLQMKTGQGAIPAFSRLARISHTCISRFDFSEIRTIVGSLWVIRLPIAAVRAAMAVLTGLHTA